MIDRPAPRPGGDRDLIDRLRREIVAYENRVAHEPDRSQRVMALERLIRHLGGLERWVKKHSSSAEAVLSDEFLPMLGQLLSTSAMEHLLGRIAWGIDERKIKSALDRHGWHAVAALDALTKGTRERAALQEGPQLLARMAAMLREPLERQLRMEKLHRGGRPQDIKRNHVVDALARAWITETGSLPPSGKTGPFVDRCAGVLNELGLNADGLADCIRRTVRRLRGANG